MANYSHLTSGGGNFSDAMLKNGFGIVTVMNARVYDVATLEEKYTDGKFFERSATEIVSYLKNTVNEDITKGYICTLDTLKIANATQDGPSKTITGGQYSNPLIKYGKSARLEMQDALGNADAIEALCGGITEWTMSTGGTPVKSLVALHIGEDFAGPKCILGDSFIIDRKTGKQIKVNIIFYQFLPDSIFNLTQDAEGDATVFDMNGDLLTTDIKIGTNGTDEGIILHGEVYSIVAA